MPMWARQEAMDMDISGKRLEKVTQVSRMHVGNETPKRWIATIDCVILVCKMLRTIR